MSLRGGTEVGGYVVEGVLGGGGMAVVYAARHRILGTHHAIKVLSIDRPELRQRLWREVELHSRLDHPNLVPVRDVIEAERAQGVVMPLVRGPTLQALLAARSLEVDEGLTLFRGIVAGVAHAHARGVAHCDLKPGNVLLDLDSGGVVPRVSDFGSARLTGEWGGDVVIGTPGYTSPEQRLDPASADHRADMYALGCVLHELLTGQRAFPDPRTMVRSDAVLPERWAALVEELLQPDPQRRPRADELHERLVQGGNTRSLAALAREARKRTPTLLVERELPPPDPDAPPHNLEPERDEFIGRDRELLALRENVRPGRLVTLVGPGGAGKTRLARRFGSEALLRSPGGVWLCALAGARTERELVAELLGALGLPPGIGERLEGSLATFAGGVVVLDNLEQLEPSAIERLGVLVAGAPEVSFLGTSREPVGLAGEQVVPLEPLEPQASARLFVERAASAGVRLELRHEAVGDAVRRIVELLDGLPLALEIAAARVAFVSLASLAEQITGQLDARRSGEGPDRQRTLRAALDASWQLLEPWERAAFAQLSVFEGGFTLEAADAVLGADARPPQGGISRAIERLIRRSLLRVEEEGVRFGMLVTVAAYANERLADLGGARAAEARHGQWFAREGGALAEGSEQARHRLIRASDRANLVAAARRALRRGDDDVAAHAALGALTVLVARGPFDAAVDLGEAVLQIVPPGTTRCALQIATGEALGQAQALGQGIATLQSALDEAHAAGWVALELDAMVALGRLEALQDLRRGEQRLEALRQRAVQVGDVSREARALEALATIWSESSQPEDAEAAATRALALLEELQEPRSARLVSILAACLGHTGDSDEAHALAQEALSLALRQRDLSVEGRVYNTLGNLATRQKRPQDAIVHFQAAMRSFRRAGSEMGQLFPLHNLAYLYDQQGNLDEARALHAENLAISRRIGDRLSECRALSSLAFMDSQDERLPEAIAGYRASIEVALSCDPLHAGFTRANLANVLRRKGDLDEARREAERAVAELEGDSRWCGMARNILGNVLVDAGDFEGGEAQLRRVIAEGSQELQGHACHILSQIYYYRASQPERAREMAERAVAAGAANAMVHGYYVIWAGVLAARAGDTQRALEALDVVRTLVKNLPQDSPLLAELEALEARVRGS